MLYILNKKNSVHISHPNLEFMSQSGARLRGKEEM